MLTLPDHLRYPPAAPGITCRPARLSHQSARPLPHRRPSDKDPAMRLSGRPRSGRRAPCRSRWQGVSTAKRTIRRDTHHQPYWLQHGPHSGLVQVQPVVPPHWPLGVSAARAPAPRSALSTKLVKTEASMLGLWKFRWSAWMVRKTTTRGKTAAYLYRAGTLQLRPHTLLCTAVDEGARCVDREGLAGLLKPRY